MLARSTLIAAAGLVSLASCTDVRIELRVPTEAGARSVLLFAKQGDSLELSAVNLGMMSASYVELDDESAELWALVYDQPLLELGLEPGRVPLGTDGLPLLPAPHTYYAPAPLRADGWLGISGLPDSLAALRLAVEESALRCLEARGCFDDDGSCRLPCPEPLAIAPPIPIADSDIPPPLPEPPTLGPCAPWLSVMRGQVETCAPWPDEGPAQCPPGELQLPGSAVCERLGRCTGARFPTLPSGRDVYYVDATALAGGDGSLTTPFRSIGEAVLAVSAPAAIAIARGEYRETVGIGPLLDVELYGACETETIIDGGLLEGLRALGRGGAHDLTLRGHFGAQFDSSEGFVLEGVMIEAEALGLVVDYGGVVSARRLLIAGSSDGGILLRREGQLTLEQSRIEDVQSGITLDSSTTATLTDVAIRRVHRGANGAMGLTVDAASLFARRLLIEQVDQGGLAIRSASHVHIDQLLVRDIGTRTVSEDPSDGQAVLVMGGSRLLLERSALLRMGSFGLGAQDASTEVTLHDSYLSDVPYGPRIDGAMVGLAADDGAQLTVERARMERTGVGAVASKARLDLRDFSLRSEHEPFIGVDAQEGSTVELTRALIERAGVALQTQAFDARIDGSDLTVRDGVPERSDAAVRIATGTITLARALFHDLPGTVVSGEAGTFAANDLLLRDTGTLLEDPRGVEMKGLGRVELERVRLERVAGSGLVFNGPVTATIKDLHVTAPDTRLLNGPALTANGQARVEVQAALIEARYRGAFLVRLLDTLVVAHDVTIEGIHDGCPIASCSPESLGALVIERKGALQLERFAIRNGRVPALLDLGGEADFSHGVISGNQVAIDSIDPNYDLRRLGHRVHYTDNQTLLHER